MIMLLLVVTGFYFASRRMWMMKATGRTKAATPPSSAPDTARPTDFDRWTALDDRQLIRLLDESSP